VRLSEFAYFPKDRDYRLESFFRQLADQAKPEDWGKSYFRLRYYCETNLELAHEQKLLYYDPHGRFVVWRIGDLRTNDGLPLYAFFNKLARPIKQDHEFKTIRASAGSLSYFYREHRDGHGVDVPIPDPPLAPDYEIVAYEPDHYIDFDWKHHLRDAENKERLLDVLIPHGVSREVEDAIIDRMLNEQLLQTVVFGAVRLAHRRWDDIPPLLQYRFHQEWSTFRYEHLLPLYITHDTTTEECPDLLAVLVENSAKDAYSVETLLPPEYAYNRARAMATSATISRIRSWVKHSIYREFEEEQDLFSVRY
jgi:hypothetical protein